MKLQEIKEKTIDELKDLALEGKKELCSLKMSHNKLKQLENTAQIKNKKREIARIKTVLRQNEMNA